MLATAIVPADVDRSLALAVIGSSITPLVLLDASLSIIACSDSFLDSFQLDEGASYGRPLTALGNGEWNSRQLMVLLKATVSGSADVDAYEMDLARSAQPTRQLVLNARKLDYGDPDNVRVLLTVSDVTDARHAAVLKQEILREKQMLLQELQHRVANSLQIIASVLMQNARRVQSDEARRHLSAAHHRVMSVAAVQAQLSLSSADRVRLSAYLDDLCESIGASMIRDHDLITLTTDVDGTTATATNAVSLGLIVTELVLNALKHAFPGDRRGRVKVGYRTTDDGWSLVVQDDGVGIPTVSTRKSGLGTSLIQALSRQLGASVSVSDGSPGTIVTVTRTPGTKVPPL